MEKSEEYSVMLLEELLERQNYWRSSPHEFIDFFTKMKRPKFSVIRLSKHCAKEMGIPDSNIDHLKSFLDGVIVDLKTLKPRAEEAYAVNRLIRYHYNNKEIPTGIELLFKESYRLTVWTISSYILNLKVYYKIVKRCLLSDDDTINIPTRGMIQFLLLQTAAMTLCMMHIQCRAKCVLKDKKKRDIPPVLTPIVDEIHNIAHKSLFMAHAMQRKACVWYKFLYLYSCKFPCADDHLHFTWTGFNKINKIEDVVKENTVQANARCFGQFGPFKLIDLIKYPEKYFFNIGQQNTFKLKKDYHFKLLHIFGNVAPGVAESNCKYIDDALIRIKNRFEKQEELYKFENNEEDLFKKSLYEKLEEIRSEIKNTIEEEK